MKLINKLALLFIRGDSHFLRIFLLKYGWFGNYKNWNIAKNKSSGYDNQIIIEKVKNASLAVKNNEAYYERDGCLFYEVNYNWNLVGILLNVASVNNNAINILDFGGSLGSSYFQNRKMLSSISKLEWSIIEQSNFVEVGIKYLKDEQLDFFESYDDFIKAKGKPKIVLFSSVLQYLENPYQIINFYLSQKIEYIYIDLNNFIDKRPDQITIQVVPPQKYNASYPSWFFNKINFVEFFLNLGYEKISEWRNEEEINYGYHGGLIFRLIK
jgi:putative methyltransferase (TIGR04325 family)